MKKKQETLKDLTKHLPTIIGIYQKVFPYSDLAIKTYDDASDSLVEIYTGENLINYTFLEPLSTYCIAKTITWEIASVNNELILRLRTNED